MVRFDKERIGTDTCESASVCDVNQDGFLDIVSGEYWYEGPDFMKRHKIADIKRVDDYYDNFSDFPMDITGNGYPDIISGGWWGETLCWKENPGNENKPWLVHDIARVGSIERPCFHDIDGDGITEIIPNCPGNPLRVFKLIQDPHGKGTGKFREYVIRKEPGSHGIGFGDITGNGRCDIVMADGWLEAPASPWDDEWIWHPEFDLGIASVPILVFDVNGDGVNDLIVGQAHGYGLAWYEQKSSCGMRQWIKHDICLERSQYHDLQLADIDRDGIPELITGKRYHAHCGHDPGSEDPVGIYYFKINQGRFERFTVDYGRPEEGASGLGIYFWIADLNGNGWLDIIAPGKEGLYIFRNRGES